jgi:Ca2+-binding RTX toxin-like protein
MAIITGDETNNLLDGGADPDTLNGLGGDDILSGAGGNDTANGGEGDDTLNGGDGDDFLAGDAGDDVLNGGAGQDRASYASATAGVVVDLTIQGLAQNTGGAGLDTLNSIENLQGSEALADVFGRTISVIRDPPRFALWQGPQAVWWSASGRFPWRSISPSSTDPP